MSVNPFSYGHELLPNQFTGRNSDVMGLRDRLERFSGQRLYLAEPRRVGKSWFVQKVGSVLKIPFIYVDLFHEAGSTEDLCIRLASGLLDAVHGREASVEKERTAREWFGAMDPMISANGALVVQAPGGAISTNTFLKILDTAETAARRTAGEHIVIAVDEFQDLPQVLKAYEKRAVDDLWKRLRARFLKMKHVSLILSGSRRTTLRDVLERPESPFYRSGFEAIGLSPIKAEDWHVYIRDRFNELGKPVPRDFTEKILETTEGEPTYTKMICHQLAFCRSDKITAADISDSIRHVHQTESGLVISRTISNIRTDERRVLKFLAGVQGSVKMYEQETLTKLGLSSTQMCRVLDRLVDEGLVDKAEDYFYTLRDKLYRDWALYQRDRGRGGSAADRER